MSDRPAQKPLDFEAAGYWEERLSDDFSLRGTGHISYSEGYNDWLYRRKGEVLGAALEGIGSGSRILDVGSGTGWCVAQLLARGMRVEGCDLTSTSVERLSERYPAVPFMRVAIGNDAIPRDSGAFGAVTVMDVLYHVTDDALFSSALREIARVLEPGGLLVATDQLGSDDAAPAEHVRFRSRGLWEEAAAGAGLQLERLLPLYRWLSRDREELRFQRLPGRVRGLLEYGLERVRPDPPHMRCAVLRRAIQS